MAEIVILGAGITGLSAAYHLEKKGYFEYKIYEKEANVGGLCRSVTQDGFTFDFTGHLLHSNNSYFSDFIDSIIGLENFNSIIRRSFVYSQDIYTKYPYQSNLYGLPERTIIDCIKGFINRPKIRKPPRLFYRWVIATFGSGFGEYFFFPYQEKICSYNIYKLSTNWIGRFVPPTSLDAILEGALTITPEQIIGYNAHFYYPKQGGIQFWVLKLAQQIKNTIYTNCCVKEIDLVGKKVFFTNGTVEPFKVLISTIPLNYLITMLKEPANTSFARASKKLLCNSVVNFNIGIKGNSLPNKHWIYYPEKKYPFYRIGFPHNFSAHMVPEGGSSLYGEFSYLNSSPELLHETLKHALACTYKLFSISPQDIATQKIITIDHAYVIYDRWRDTHVPLILERLQEYNIYSIGRYGAWKYSSMQEALLDGKTITDTLLAEQEGL